MSGRLYDAWLLHRRAMVIVGIALAALIVVVVAAGTVLYASGGTSKSDAEGVGTKTSTAAPASRHEPAPASGAPATDIAYWNGLASVQPATTAAYPPIAAAALSDPGAYSKAFATELFTRDYGRSSRAQLIAWAQYEDAPLRSGKYPRDDWSKVLVDSLTDLTWDQATQTPIPAAGPWAVLASEHATWRVDRATSRVDPQWEQQVADGYQPGDRLASVWDVDLHITQRSKVGTSGLDVSLAVQLGTSARGRYGVAATNNFELRKAD
jgi:hypothetical protein